MLNGLVIDGREAWINVSVLRSRAELGAPWASRERAKELDSSPPSDFRIHVRLKPEGAPARYASEANRRAWEWFPGGCRHLVALGAKPEYIRR